MGYELTSRQVMRSRAWCIYSLALTTVVAWYAVESVRFLKQIARDYPDLRA